MKKSKKILSAALALSLVIAQFSGGSVASAAKKPALNKTTLTITAGKKATLKVKNKIKGSTYKWSSSKTKVATVTKAGVVKGIKAGKSTIKCKVKTKATKKVKAKTYTLKCKVTVKKKATANVTASPDIEPTTEPTIEPSLEPTIEPTVEPTVEPTIEPTVNPEELTVATQEELESALEAVETRSLTLETTAEETFTIPEGEYKDIELIVNAPNADIENSGVFKSITIKAIKSSTWTEKAQGNVFMVMAVAAHINVIKEAIIEKIIFLKVETQANAVLTINEGGIIENVTVQANVKLTIDGNSATSVPVAVENTAENTEITSAVPVAMETAIDVKVTLEKGAENSTVKATSDVSVEIQNNTTTSVNVTKSTGITQTVGAGTSTTVSNTNSSYNPGTTVVRPSTPTPTPTPVPTATPAPEEDKTITLYENEEGSDEAVTITAEELSALLGDTTSVESCTIHIDTVPNSSDWSGAIQVYSTDWTEISTGTADWGDISDIALDGGNDYILTATQTNAILTKGLVVSPNGNKITKVTIEVAVSADGKPDEEPDQPAEVNLPIVLYENGAGSEEDVVISATEINSILEGINFVNGYTLHIDTVATSDDWLGAIKVYFPESWTEISTGTAGWAEWDDPVSDSVFASGNDYILSSDQFTSLSEEGLAVYPNTCKITKITIVQTVPLYENEEGSSDAVTITVNELKSLLGDINSKESYTLHIDAIKDNEYEWWLGSIQICFPESWTTISTGDGGWDNMSNGGNNYLLSSEQLTSLFSEGLAIYFNGCKITKITIIKGL